MPSWVNASLPSFCTLISTTNSNAQGYLEVPEKYIVEGHFQRDSFDEGKSILVVNLMTGDEVETRWVAESGMLIGGEGKDQLQFSVDFKKGTFQEVKSK